MRNAFISRFALFIMFLTGNIVLAYAQDSLSKPVVRKTVVRQVIIKPGTIDPLTGKPVIPINPKTGKPYSKWGYGYYSKNKYDATAAHKADSLKKSGIVQTSVPVVPKPDSAAKAAPVDNSLNGQYQYLLTKVMHYQQPFVSAFWKNVTDTLKTGQRKFVDAQARLLAQSKTISSLQADADTKAQQGTRTDDINVFGIEMAKGTYNIIMWGLVIVLGIIAVVVIAATGKYRYQANYRTNLYNELEEEFKTYKSKANDKEKKLARELQTERNKVDELLGRG